MRFFGGGGAIDPAAVARTEASRQSIVAGGLPLNAIDRLREQASRQGTPQHLFSSDLSVNELLLTSECGFEPLGQVMGSCVYNVGWQFLPNSGWFNASGELLQLTQSQTQARGLAFKRLKEEAQLLNADGVVGVRFEKQGGDWAQGTVEFIAIGTAVRRTDAPPLAGAAPFVSNLSGQDHWMLRKAGFKPVGFSFGNCSWFQYPDWMTSAAMMSWGNAELTSITQGAYWARELAMDRLTADSRLVSAEGVVGVTVDSHMERVETGQNQQSGFIMHFTAWGTAVAREDSNSDCEIAEPYVSLLDSTQQGTTL